MPDAGLKKLARSDALKVGHFIVEFATPGVGHLMKNAGCDFVLFDTEHSGFHHETIKSALRYFEAANLPAIVRVPSKSYHHVARAMDMGAEGLMVPMVNNAEEIRGVLDSMKYVPEGRRGVAMGVAHDNYIGGPVLPGLAAANKRTTLFAQIETADGVENVDAIAAVKGVDALWIGHFDLTCSLGIPGQFDHPKFIDATKKTVEACKKHGKALGRLVPDAQSGIDHADMGFDFICYSGDVWVFLAGVKAGVDAIRAGARPQGKTKGKGKKSKKSK